FLLELVVDVRRKDNLVLLNEKPRRLNSKQQILRRYQLGFALPNPDAGTQGPSLDLPRRQAIGEREFDLGCPMRIGNHSGCPETRVSEVRANHGRSGVLIAISVGGNDAPLLILPSASVCRGLGFREVTESRRSRRGHCRAALLSACHPGHAAPANLEAAARS